MTTLTDTQVITASGGLVELGYATATSPVTVDTSAKVLIADTTVVCDGSPILVEFYSPYYSIPNNATNNYGRIDLYVDGVQQQYLAEPFYTPSAIGQILELGPIYTKIRLTPSAGSHTFGIRGVKGANNWTVGAGNNSAGNYLPMWMRVSKIVQATQWPAVTTGTIICTSSTRPASPFEGQTIYETDTDRTLTYNNTAWVSPSTTFRPPMCRVYRAAALSHTGTGTFQTIAFDTESFTQTESGMWSSGTPTRVTPQTAGVYLVTANVNFNTNATGVRGLGLYKNGTVNPFAYQDAAGSASLSNGLFLSGTVNLSVGDYVQPLVFQNSGGNLAYVAGNGEQVSFSVTWMGKP